MRIAGNRVLVGVDAVNRHLPQQEGQQFPLLVEGKRLHQPFEVQQRRGDDVFVGHHPLTVSDVDFGLLDLLLQLVLLLGQVLGGSERFPAEVLRIHLARQLEIALQLLTHRGVAALEFRQFRFQRTQGLALFLIGSRNRRFDDFWMSADFADDAEHEIVHGAGGHVAYRTGRGAAILADVVAGVVEVGIALLVLLAARLGSEAVAAHAAMNDALEQRFMGVAIQKPLVAGIGTPRQRLIGLLPEFGADQRFVLAGMILALVADDALVDGVGDDNLNLVRDEALGPNDQVVAPAALHRPFRCAQAFGIELRRHLGGTAQLLGQFKDALGDGGFHRIGVDLFGDRVVGVAQWSPATVPHPLLGALGDLVGHPFGDHLALELAEGKEHVEHEHAHGRAGVEALGGGDKVYLVLVEDLPELVEVRQVTGDAVNLVGHHDIHLPGFDFAQECLHAGPVEVFPGESRIVEVECRLPTLMNVDGDGVLADVALAFQRVVFAAGLVVGGNAGVDGAADQGSRSRAV